MSTDAKKNTVRASRRVECALMPDIYAHDSCNEAVTSNIVDEVPLSAALVSDSDSSAGFNPYDTGVLYKK